MRTCFVVKISLLTRVTPDFPGQHSDTEIAGEREHTSHDLVIGSDFEKMKRWFYAYRTIFSGLKMFVQRIQHSLEP